MKKGKSIVGLISDTHGLMRPEALNALKGADLILHAGDIGRPEVLEALRSIAPIVAVRGNNDKGAWANELADSEAVTVGRFHIYLLHDLKKIGLDPADAGFHVVVSGHSHKPSVQERGEVLYLNPGSAGPRRFKLPVSLARLTVSRLTIAPELVELRL